MRFRAVHRGKWAISTSEMREKQGIMYFAEDFDNISYPRGPYLMFDGERIETDIFGQVPLFVSEGRVDTGIFEGGIRHDPTKRILLGERVKTESRELLPYRPVKEPVEELSRIFRESVSLRANGRIAVLLSGGVDSSAIATVLLNEGIEFRALSVADGEDYRYAERLSKKLGFELIPVHLDMDEIEDNIPEIYRIIGMKEYLNSTPVYLPVITSLSITFYFALREAEKNGMERVLSGIGSEELFAGFRDWTREPMEKQIFERTYTIYKRDLWRDYALANHFGMHISYPFLDREFASVALSIPVELKIKDGTKKWIWRKAAEKLGVPEENAWRKNRAAQYGSGADRILERLAKRSGKRYRMKYLQDMLSKTFL